MAPESPPSSFPDSEVPGRQRAPRFWPSTATAIKVVLATSIGFLLVVLALVGWTSYQDAVRDAQLEARDDARSVAAHMLRIIEAANLLLLHQRDIAASMDRGDARSLQEANERLHRLAEELPYVFRIFMIDEKGDVYASSMPEWPPLNTRNRDYFRLHEAGGSGLHISTVLRSQATGEPIVTLSQRVQSADGAFRGIVLVSFELDALRDFAQQLLPARQQPVFQLIGPEMQILVDGTARPGLVGKQLTPQSQALLHSAESSVRTYAAQDDVPRVWAHERVGQHPLFVRVGIETARIAGDWARAAAPYGLVSLVIIALLVVLSAVAAKHAHAAEAARRAVDLVNRDLEDRVRRRTGELDKTNGALREAVRSLETLNSTNANLASDLDLERIVQATTDAGVAVTGAAFGAFFYNRTDERGESYTLYALSGVPREAFARFPMPRNTAVFGPTFRGEGIVRIDDVMADPRYGKSAPYHGMPPGHLPVRSYLAVPVTSRSGEILGGLFFGHPEAAVFTAQHERLIAGIAAQTAMAMDNARLFEAAKSELEQRKRVEEHQAFLLKELSHRVKNSLAVVQAVASQTLKHAESPDSFVASFRGRLMALGKAHDLLSKNEWHGASLREILLSEMAPFAAADSGRLELRGDDLLIQPDVAPSVAMIIHELATNAAKHGALSNAGGVVGITWSSSESGPGMIRIVWSERGGPAVRPPRRRGFGLMFIERVVVYQLEGKVSFEYDPAGFRCAVEIAASELTPGEIAADTAAPAAPIVNPALQ